MLGKLLKYDLRYVYKTLGAYYIFTIVSVICGVLLQQIPEPPFIIYFLGEFLTNAGIGLSIGLIINAFTRTWIRFHQNLYGDESYLTHTLPISRLQLFASKFISSVITLLLSLIVVTIVLLIYVPGAASSVFSTDIFDIIPGTSLTVFSAFVVFTLALIIQAVFAIMCGFTGIIIGNRFNTARGAISAAAGVGCYLVVALLLVGIIFILSNFDPELGDLIARGHQPNLPTLINCLWACIVTYSVAIVVLFITSVKLLNRGVNVD